MKTQPTGPNPKRIQHAEEELEELIDVYNTRDARVLLEWFIALENIKGILFTRAIKHFDTDLHKEYEEYCGIEPKAKPKPPGTAALGRLMDWEDIIPARFVDRCTEDIRKSLKSGLVQIGDANLHNSIYDFLQGTLEEEGPMYTFKVGSNYLHIYSINEMVIVEQQEGEYYLTLDSTLEPTIWWKAKEVEQMEQGDDEEESATPINPKYTHPLNGEDFERIRAALFNDYASKKLSEKAFNETVIRLNNLQCFSRPE